jgi:hypothetical protein
MARVELWVAQDPNKKMMLSRIQVIKVLFFMVFDFEVQK